MTGRGCLHLWLGAWLLLCLVGMGIAVVSHPRPNSGVPADSWSGPSTLMFRIDGPPGLYQCVSGKGCFLIKPDAAMPKERWCVTSTPSIGPVQCSDDNGKTWSRP